MQAATPPQGARASTSHVLGGTLPPGHASKVLSPVTLSAQRQEWMEGVGEVAAGH